MFKINKKIKWIVLSVFMINVIIYTYGMEFNPLHPTIATINLIMLIVAGLVGSFLFMNETEGFSKGEF